MSGKNFNSFETRSKYTRTCNQMKKKAKETNLFEVFVFISHSEPRDEARSLTGVNQT